MYFFYTVEIDLSCLAINTILVTDELKNMDKEGSKLSSNDENIEGQFDEISACKIQFNLIKNILQRWIEDLLNGNENYQKYAEILHLNVHKYICS